MSAPLRVVVVDHTAALGGAELALLRLLDALPGDVQPVVMLFADGPLADAVRERGVPVTVVALPAGLTVVDRHTAGGSRLDLLLRAVRTVPHVVRVARALRRRDADVVHTTSLKADLIGGIAARLARTPLVWHVHDRIAADYLPGALVTLVRTLARWLPDRVVVNSEATAATLPGVAATIAYPGFSPDQVGPEPADRTRPVPPVVGLLGRISPTKGQREFLRAAVAVHAAVPQARFRIVGAALFAEADYEREVRDECRRLGLDEVVEFTGFVADPAAALDELTVCVHASPTPEPFGQVVVEAMIRGVPVVATSGGGVDEIVAPPGPPLGWLVPPGDTDALAAAVIEALTRPAEAQARAERAWASAIRRFPVAETARRISGVWRSVARGR